jgi:DNA polymerase-3 subunit beta
VIIPRKALGEIRKAIELFGEEVTISFDDRVMQFVGSQVSFKTRLIEGKFPNCDPIIPKDNHLVAIVDRERLVSALRIVSSISYEKLKPVKLTLTEGKLRLESEKAEYGEVSDEMEADYSGEDFQVGFNSRYLLDALGVIQTERVKLECKNPMSPSVIRAADDEEYLAVIMPLRIEWSFVRWNFINFEIIASCRLSLDPVSTGCTVTMAKGKPTWSKRSPTSVI